MKHKIILLIISGFFLVNFYSCQEEDLEAPKISHIRFIEQDTMLDSIVVGSYIAIIGEGFDGLNKIYVNDHDVFFLPTFVTNSAIIVEIPSDVPYNRSGDMGVIKLVNTAGSVETTVFVKPGVPKIESITPEFGAPGDTLTVRGKSLVEIVKVIFGGNIQAGFKEVSPTELKIVVPENYEIGKIEISNITGTGLSASRFGLIKMLLDFDVKVFSEYWGGTNEIIDATLPGISPKPLTGNYMKMEGVFLKDAWWSWWFGITATTPGFGITTTPNTVFKFDYFIGSDQGINNLEIRFFKDNGTETGVVYQNGALDLKKGDQWQTFEIPITEFKDGNAGYAPIDEAELFMFIPHPSSVTEADANINWNFDNFRFVEIEE